MDPKVFSPTGFEARKSIKCFIEGDFRVVVLIEALSARKHRSQNEHKRHEKDVRKKRDYSNGELSELLKNQTAVLIFDFETAEQSE